MGALIQTYVDPSIAANSGEGTIESPYGDLQWALDNTSRNTANGNQFNIKFGTAEVLTAPLDFATFTTPTVATAPLVFRGYAETLNDGGVGAISGGGGAVIGSISHTHWRDMEVYNGGANTLVTLGAGNSIVRCKIYDTTGIGINLALGNCLVSECEITDCDEGVVCASTMASVVNNFFKFGSTRYFSKALKNTASSLTLVERNIFSIGSSGTAISLEQLGGRVVSNSIFAAASNGVGIAISAASRSQNAMIVNNVIEGFSGEGGRGISFINTTTVPLQYAHNACFDNETNYHQIGDAIAIEDIDNEVLTASPFAKSGADTFANRFAYFAPVDTGNIRGGAIQ
jgi:hypothetical protein